MNKQPEKTAKTRQNIIDAFWRLAAKDGIYGVTVGAVTKEAKLNRGTFYVYFKDIWDLIESEEKSITESYHRIIASAPPMPLGQNFATMSEMTVNFIKEHDDKLLLLLGKGGDANFQRLVYTEIEETMRGTFSLFCEEEMVDYAIAYYCAAVLGLLMRWYDRGKKTDLKMIIDLAENLSRNGYMSLIPEFLRTGK